VPEVRPGDRAGRRRRRRRRRPLVFRLRLATLWLVLRRRRAVDRGRAGLRRSAAVVISVGPGRMVSLPEAGGLPSTT
jgi:hypothetical protein